MHQKSKRKIFSGLMALVMILVMINASWVSASSDYEEPIEAVWETTEEVTADDSGEAEESIAEDSEPETDGETAAEVSLIEDGESVDEEETSAEIAGLMEEPEDMTASFLLLSDEELLPEEEVLEEETGSETAQMLMLSAGEEALTVSEYTLYANSSSSRTTYTLEGSYPEYAYHRWTSSNTRAVGLQNANQPTATAYWLTYANTSNITHQVSRDGRNWTTVDIYHLTIIASSGNNHAAVFNFKVENADIIGYYYNQNGSNTTGEQLVLSLKEDGTGLYTMPYTWNGQNNYWYFFVKPHDGYLITGLDAGINGTSGDIFDINASSYSYRTSGGGTVSIERFPEIHKHAEKLKKQGYVGVFGYSRENSSSTVIAPITVKGYKPSLNVQATTEVKNVMPGQTIDLNVTLTPESGTRANSTDLQLTSLVINGNENKPITTVTINGEKVELKDLPLTKNSDGTYSVTIPYTITEEDYAYGKIDLKVNASVNYELTLNNANSGQDIKTSTTVKNSGDTTVPIADKNRIVYRFFYDPDNLGKDFSSLRPAESTYYQNQRYQAASSDLQIQDDPDNGGYWTFDGWYYDNTSAENRKGEKVGTYVDTSSGERIVLNGYWTFHRTHAPLTVTKNVTGNLGDKGKSFSFTLTDENGKSIEDGTFNLKHQESKTFSKLEIGKTYYLKETGNQSYEVTVQVNGTKVAYDQQHDGYPVNIANADNEVVVTNHKQVTVDTGITLPALPYTFILILLTLSLFSLWMWHRRRTGYDY